MPFWVGSVSQYTVVRMAQSKKKYHAVPSSSEETGQKARELHRKPIASYFQMNAALRRAHGGRRLIVLCRRRKKIVIFIFKFQLKNALRSWMMSPKLVVLTLVHLSSQLPGKVSNMEVEVARVTKTKRGLNQGVLRSPDQPKGGALS